MTQINMTSSSNYSRLIMIGINLELYKDSGEKELQEIRDKYKETFSKFFDFDELILAPGTEGVYYFEQKKY